MYSPLLKATKLHLEKLGLAIEVKCTLLLSLDSESQTQADYVECNLSCIVHYGSRAEGFFQKAP